MLPNQVGDCIYARESVWNYWNLSQHVFWCLFVWRKIWFYMSMCTAILGLSMINNHFGIYKNSGKNINICRKSFSDLMQLFHNIAYLALIYHNWFLVSIQDLRSELHHFSDISNYTVMVLKKWSMFFYTYNRPVKFQHVLILYNKNI